MNYQKSRMISGLLLLSVITLSGCGSTPGADRKKGSVEITVTYAGEPLSNGAVSLSIAKEGKGCSGNLDAEGKVTLSNIEIGNYTVSIGLADSETDAEKIVPKGKAAYKNIPKKFRSQSTTPLKAEVKEGEKTSYTFDLKE